MNLSLAFLVIADILTLAVMGTGIMLTGAGQKRSQVRRLLILFLFLTGEIVLASLSTVFIDTLGIRYMVRGVGRYSEAIGLIWFLYVLTRKKNGEHKTTAGEKTAEWWIAQQIENAYVGNVRAIHDNIRPEYLLEKANTDSTN